MEQGHAHGAFRRSHIILATMIHLSGTEKRRYRVFLYAGYILYFFMAYLNLSSKVVTAGVSMRMAFTMSWLRSCRFVFPGVFFPGLSIIILAKQLMESENRFKRKT
jgi:hypothetical protein